MQHLPFSAWICLCLARLLLEANFFPQSWQLLLFFDEKERSRHSELSESAGEVGAETSETVEDVGDNEGDEDRDEDMLRSTGCCCCCCWWWLLQRARMA